MTQAPMGRMSPLSSATGMKRLGREQTLSRVVPTDQGLGAGRDHALELDDRLVVKHELVALERSMQGVLRGHPVDGPQPDAFAEQLHAGPASPLGLVHRRLGIGQQGGGGGPPRRC